MLGVRIHRGLLGDGIDLNAQAHFGWLASLVAAARSGGSSQGRRRRAIRAQLRVIRAKITESTAEAATRPPYGENGPAPQADVAYIAQSDTVQLKSADIDTLQQRFECAIGQYVANLARLREIELARQCELLEQMRCMMAAQVEMERRVADDEAAIIAIVLALA